MASAIDPTLPVQGNPTTASVRSNFAAAKSEIELLQQTAGVGPAGPTGPTGPAGSIGIGTVTTGNPGTNATVTNVGSPTAATLNFTIPRGDAGTAGGGITETQAVDAVRQGNVRFDEQPASTAPTMPTTPNLAGVPTVGTGWTPTDGTATSTYTHATGTGTLAYPATITAGEFYQVIFTNTNASANPVSSFTSFFAVYFNTSTGSGGQTVLNFIMGTGNTVTVQAAANYSYVVIAPVTGWQGNFTLTRVVRQPTLNSTSFSVKDFTATVRANNIFIGRDGSGRVVTGTLNTAFGSAALRGLTTGGNNVAFGSNALLSLGTNSHNVAVGDNCQQFNTNALRATAVGRACLINNKGDDNVALGCQALTQTTIGTGNIGIGNYVFQNNRTGSNNVAIGHYAASEGASTGNHNNSIFIGVRAYPLGQDEVNQIVIGANAKGGGSNTITLGNSDITELRCNVQTISVLSDARVKDEIELANLDRCLDAVKNLPVHRWHWQPIAGNKRDRHVTGFLSDNVKKIFPKAVTAHDENLSVRDEEGNLEMITVSLPADEENSRPYPEAYQVPKTIEIKGLQRVTLTEILPTLWGAVQALIQKVEQLSITPGSQTT